MFAIYEITAPVGFVQESIAITGIQEEFFDTVDGPEVFLDSKLCQRHLKLAHMASAARNDFTSWPIQPNSFAPFWK